MAEHQQRFPRRDERIAADLVAPVRNRYFYGKLLDVHQLEMEQEYFNAKRHLVNRLVIGPGVVCGLKVEVTPDQRAVIVRPGLAIDRCGREIVVPARSQPVPLPDPPEYDAQKTAQGFQGRPGDGRHYGRQEHRRYHYCSQPYVHAVLCYHECESDPVPALHGDCGTMERCASGSIREQYRIELKRGFVPERTRNFPSNIIDEGKIDYDTLVDYVMSGCRRFPDDCCVPLANIELRRGENGWVPDPDNSIRPIVYTNRLLFYLIEALGLGDEREEPVEV
jgi:hypothetical protein